MTDSATATRCSSCPRSGSDGASRVAPLASARPFRTFRFAAGLFAGVAAHVLAAAAAAQGNHQIQLEVAASHARPPAGLVGEPATYVTGALHWFHAGRVTTFGGAGAGLAADENAAGWVSAYGGAQLTRVLSPAVTAGVDASAVGFRLDRADAYRVAALRIEPLLRFGAGTTHVTVQLHGGVGRAASRVEDVDDTEDLWSAGGALRVERAVGRHRVGVVAAAYDARTGAFASGGASVETWVGEARAELEARVWSVPGEDAIATVQLRLDVPLTRVLRAVAAGGRSDPDPLLAVRAGTYVSAGISWNVLATLAPPPPALIELVPARGEVRFTVAAEDIAIGGTGGSAAAVSSVELLGDFTEWQPVPLRQVRSGQWTVELPIAAGVYHFVFRVNGELWLPPAAPGRGRDEWGRPTATLVVPGA